MTKSFPFPKLSVALQRIVMAQKKNSWQRVDLSKIKVNEKVKLRYFEYDARQNEIIFGIIKYSYQGVNKQNGLRVDLGKTDGNGGAVLLDHLPNDKDDKALLTAMPVITEAIVNGIMDKLLQEK